MNKRDTRREKRAAVLGPEREIVSFSSDKALLSCGHIIVNPPVQKTVHMRPPKFYRCFECQKVGCFDA